ncbi:hypothetical protein [Halorussus halophilus]|uniref:hypothetical protein n=1 Tax=Halorussus halophilus TaxID=2650975 RepID=UPI001301973D|nr:hypothetical protein [Halorussus halophilus]
MAHSPETLYGPPQHEPVEGGTGHFRGDTSRIRYGDPQHDATAPDPQLVEQLRYGEPTRRGGNTTEVARGRRGTRDGSVTRTGSRTSGDHRTRGDCGESHVPSITP